MEGFSLILLLFQHIAYDMQAVSGKEVLNKDEFLFSFGKKQKAIARSIVVHPDLGLVFVADTSNTAIQVYTQSGDHVTTHRPILAAGPYRPSFLWGMTYKYGTLYTTDISNNGVISLNDFATIAHYRWGGCQTISLRNPRGLSCDEDSNLYVADKDNHRICVFDYELKPVRILARGEVEKPRDLQVVGAELAVLTEDEPFLVVFTLSGEKLRILDHLKKYCIEPWFFCIDEDWNIYISDYDLYCCSVFKQTGELVKRLFKPQDKLVSVFGISITDEKKIFISTSNSEHPLQIFPGVTINGTFM